MMVVMRCSKDVTWKSRAPAYESFNFFKIDVDVIKGNSPNESKTTTALVKNELENIHVVWVLLKFQWSISAKKTKMASCRELLNELKSRWHNPKVPEECFDDLEKQLVELEELLKRNKLVDHEFAVKGNNTSKQKKG